MDRTKESTGKIVIHPATIQLFIDATWEFAHSIVWGSEPLSEAESNIIQYYIREYYEAIPAGQFTQRAMAHFSSYCEKILLTRKYERSNSEGFAGIRNWYERWRKKRQLLKRLTQAGFD
jgi:hypothetical protein